jgi:hypothetical protein
MSSERDALLTQLLARVEALEHANQRLRDERDIQRLQTAYGYYVDKAQWDQAADLFDEEGTLEINHRGFFRGQARIRQYLHHLGRLEHGCLFNHLQLQPLITVAGDGLTAAGRWRAPIQVAYWDKIAFDGECIYENRYIKRDGIWKISRLHAFTTFYVEKDPGWQSRVMGKVGEFPDLPPDAPATVDYEPYPGVFIPPYHYPNPVSGRE